jgi:hypothetical protein
MPRLWWWRAESRTMVEEMPAHVEIIFDRHVFEYMLHELHRYPTSEEGGKYIGYIDLSQQNRSKNRHYRVIIADFLPGGPGARRTAVEFLPDGEFQEGLFRQAESRDGNVEHVGTWHSHHCNGLDRLSDGDIEGYFKTVNKKAYRPDVFVASLVKQLPRHPHDTGWIDHFLFVRNEERFYKITDHITIADCPSAFADITGHTKRHEHVDPPAALWHETEIGRKTLAEDKRFFTDRFGEGLRATRRDGVISITCGTSSKRIAVSYPLSPGDREVKINVGSGSRTILTIGCDYSDRSVAYVACLSALEQL